MTLGVQLSRRSFLGLTATTVAASLIPGRAAATNPPAPTLRLPVADAGPVLTHGNSWDALGAREPVVFTDSPDPASPSRLLMHYDGCGAPGWLAALAVADVLGDGTLGPWVKKGRRLKLGPAGSPYDASASSPWVLRDNQTTDPAKLWRMFYLGAAAASASPNFIPVAPYVTMTATAPDAGGPWNQALPQPAFHVGSAGVWQPGVGSPGSVIRSGGWWRMFYTAGKSTPSGEKGWGIGLARALTLDGPWTYSPDPVIPSTERAENATVWQDPTTSRWWLFTNHISSDDPAGQSGFYGQSVWAYWADDPVTGWDPANKAVVIDDDAAPWTAPNGTAGAIGMASVAQVGDRLAIFYDGSPAGDRGHMGRDIGMAWAQLPLVPS